MSSLVRMCSLAGRRDSKHPFVACRKALNEVGFFEHKGKYYCPDDYHKLFGARCPVCGDFVEGIMQNASPRTLRNAHLLVGEVVQVLNATYHQQCFKCTRCKKPFPSGQKVTFVEREHLCQQCIKSVPPQPSFEKPAPKEERNDRASSPPLMLTAAPSNSTPSGLLKLRNSV